MARIETFKTSCHLTKNHALLNCNSLNWKREHEVIDGKLFCSVSIYDPEKKEWISKSDVGTESFTEKEKGESSDSFKRACVNWGIGRESVQNIIRFSPAIYPHPALYLLSLFPY